MLFGLFGVHSSCWDIVHKSSQGKECGEMCGLPNNPTRCTTCELIIPHICAYYNVQSLGERQHVFPCLGS